MKPSKTVAIIGMIFVLIPVLYTLLWIIISSIYPGFPQARDLFMRFLPPFLQGRFLPTLSFLCLSAAGVLLCVTTIRKLEQPVKRVAGAAIILGVIQIALLLFWMM